MNNEVFGYDGELMSEGGFKFDVQQWNPFSLPEERDVYSYER